MRWLLLACLAAILTALVVAQQPLDYVCPMDLAYAAGPEGAAFAATLVSRA